MAELVFGFILFKMLIKCARYYTQTDAQAPLSENAISMKGKSL